MTEYRKNGIRLARQNKNMSETELATVLNIDVSVLRSWEIGGGSVPVNTINKLMKILEVNAEMILFSEPREGIKIKGLTEQQTEVIFMLYNIMKNNKRGVR